MAINKKIENQPRFKSFNLKSNLISNRYITMMPRKITFTANFLS